MTVLIEATALDDLARLTASFGDVAPRAASMAMNQTIARFGVPEGRREIYDQLAYPDGYLDDRLKQGRFATPTRLEGSIVGRERPTSLARFALGVPAFGRPKAFIQLMIKRGQVRTFDPKLSHVFFVPLRAGASQTDTVYNLGLAVRLKPGETLDRSIAAVHLSDNVYLLYGPSVAQAFQSVAQDIVGPLTQRTIAEFFRQFFRLTGLSGGSA